ncbi:MAG: hypothetical protein ACE5OP_06240, partial [Candidatus Glassbacteria bacterium]
VLPEDGIRGFFDSIGLALALVRDLFSSLRPVFRIGQGIYELYISMNFSYISIGVVRETLIYTVRLPHHF